MKDAGRRLELREGGRAIEVVAGGRPLVTYVHLPDDAQAESPRPYLHPVRTLTGTEVSVHRPEGHVWHTGISWALPDVGSHSFGGRATYVRGEGYRTLGDHGSQDHARFAEVGVRTGRDGGGSAVLDEDLLWRTRPAPGEERGTPVVRERRTLTVTVPADDAWVLTFVSEMTNVSSEALDIGSPTTKGREDAGYGGLFWRGPDWFAGADALLGEPDGSVAVGGDALRDRRGTWAALSATPPGGGGPVSGATVLVVDDAPNPRHPPRWFLRTRPFGCLNPAPFFGEELPFGPRARLVFRYAVVVADGPSDAARAADLAALGRVALPQDAPW